MLNNRPKKQINFMTIEIRPFPLLELPLELLCTILPLAESGHLEARLVCKYMNDICDICIVASLWNRFKTEEPAKGIDLKQFVEKIETDLACSKANHIQRFKKLDQLIITQFGISPGGKLLILKRTEMQLLLQQILDESLAIVWKEVLKQIGVQGNPLQMAAEIRTFITNPTHAQLINQISSLDLSKLKLQVLPREICNLTQLQQLSLARNQLKTLPVEIGQKSLQWFSLEDNQLTIVPVEICQLESLQQLSLDDNRLTILPVEIGQLKNLQELSIGSNKLKILPESMGQLENLQLFFLEDNELTTLPGTIAQLKCLFFL